MTLFPTSHRASQFAAGLVFVLALAAGLYGRFYDLGGRPLAVDEYYFVQSISWILESGVPEFPTGGYYTRGLIQQYLAAGSALLFGPTAFAFRLPGVFFSLLSVLVAFLYGRRLFGPGLAAAVAITLFVSSWHIEFARFIRMYAAMQFITLVFFIAIHEAYIRDNWRWRYAPHLLATVACVMHSIGVLLSPLVLIPLLQERSAKRFPRLSHQATFLAISFLTIAACGLLATFNARNVGVEQPHPEGYIAPSWPSLRTPLFPFWSVSESPLVNLAAAAAFWGAGALLAWLLQRKRRSATFVDLVLVVVVLTAVTHTFAVSGILVALLIFRYDLLHYRQQPRRRYLLLLLASLIGAFWVAYALFFIHQMPAVVPDDVSPLGFLRRVFFGWPELYEGFWGGWLRELPWLAILLGLSLVYQLATKLKRPLAEFLANPAFPVLYIMGCSSILWAPYMTTRYSYFIYPLILCTILLSCAEGMRRLAESLPSARAAASTQGVALVYVGLFSFAGDFHPRHIARVGSPEVAFRTGEFERFAPVWYPRMDFAGPAEFLNSNTTSLGQAKIVVVRLQPVSYYLESDHAVYLDRNGNLFPIVARVGGTVDLWSNQLLLSTTEELTRYVGQSGSVWVVQSTDPQRRDFSIEEVWAGEILSSAREHLSRDGRIEVVRVNLRSRGARTD